ncbi:Bug family tripartite tricarboxylate transporter substrate binding protein [Acidovorax sp. NCPPB 3576]|uniref:Bug family tripartite tricarboxylate transporter substrate binding protein n=1 Tax=Acidovorax sp. NCPPB 3576 TaxID=2940488 RepID=UPI00234B45A7|nr:tripartite tricarboxylate transporter substrate binding protein [Acidovorax sp. NCPPB 3576]WCM89830.1 tripartite tricarboxylate transporter substrate binding protein [Acidovorax sp. NCPPB 3576]
MVPIASRTHAHPGARTCTTTTTGRRALVVSAALALCGLAAPLAAVHAADAYPAKPVTLLVPYPAGGANDAVARLVGQKLGDALKQPMVIDNRPGAGTTIGTTVAAKAAPDGYTLVLGSLASHAVSPHLYAKPGYDAVADFTPIGLIGVVPMVLVVAQDSPYTSVRALVEAARKQPGALNYGSSGNGSPLHLAAELFKQAAQVQINHVPYKGGNAHTMDLMGGRLDMILDTLTSASPLIKGGKVRALAVAAPARLPELPDVPTFAEAGYPGFEVNAWYALYAPAKTSKDVVATLNTALNAVLRQPEVLERMAALGVRPQPGTPQALARFTQDELGRYGKVIQANGIRID